MTKETIEGLPEELQKLVAGMKRRSYDEIFCLFDLRKLRGYLFEDTQTYTKEQFEEQFVKKYEKIEGITR